MSIVVEICFLMLTSIELVTSTLAQAPGIARNGDDGDYNSDYYS